MHPKALSTLGCKLQTIDLSILETLEVRISMFNALGEPPIAAIPRLTATLDAEESALRWIAAVD
jgi:hypothetical protein